MRKLLRTLAAVALSALPAGCTESGTTTCGEGGPVCPRDWICIEDQKACINPATTLCGNGVTDFDKGEECDNGTFTSDDNCTSDCKKPFCGDGVQNLEPEGRSAEACDDRRIAPNGVDGPREDVPGCNADCTISDCGDGYRNLADEECDPGRFCADLTPCDEDPDTALGDCADREGLSDRECKARDTSCCTSQCKRAGCGNGVIDAGCFSAEDERCDNGLHCADGTTCSGDVDCVGKSAGVIGPTDAPDERCVARSGDGCSFDCSSLEVCGDGARDVVASNDIPKTVAAKDRKDEACDDGGYCRSNGEPCDCDPELLGLFDGCWSLACETEAIDYDPDATNPPQAPPEALRCEPRSGDGCDRDCKSKETCGDGTLNDYLHASGGRLALPEVCDDGNKAPGDGCSADCMSLERCGDGYINAGEDCDNGPQCADGSPCACPEGSELRRVPEGLGRPADVGEFRCIRAVAGAPGQTSLELVQNCAANVQTAADLSCGLRTLDLDGCDTGCGLEAGWSCVNPTDCKLLKTVCGDGIKAGNEQCDDGNTSDGDGCQRTCLLTSDAWACETAGQPCRPICGDGIVVGNETCDDGRATSGPGAGGAVAGDGCGTDCQLEGGWFCARPGSPCQAVCGDGIVKPEAGEVCDEGAATEAGAGNATSGCANCKAIANGWECLTPGESCTPTCDDGEIVGGEGCDEGPTHATGGCVDCQVTTGWRCTSKGQACKPVCGDGLVLGGEACDLGDKNGENDPEYNDTTGTCVPRLGDRECILATCEDGLRNVPPLPEGSVLAASSAAETDVDCGGSLCDPCSEDELCDRDEDCTTGFCRNGVFCAIPELSDDDYAIRMPDCIEDGSDCGLEAGAGALVIEVMPASEDLSLDTSLLGNDASTGGSFELIGTASCGQVTHDPVAGTVTFDATLGTPCEADLQAPVVATFQYRTCPEGEDASLCSDPATVRVALNQRPALTLGATCISLGTATAQINLRGAFSDPDRDGLSLDGSAAATNLPQLDSGPATAVLAVDGATGLQTGLLTVTKDDPAEPGSYVVQVSVCDNREAVLRKCASGSWAVSWESAPSLVQVADADGPDVPRNGSTSLNINGQVVTGGDVGSGVLVAEFANAEVFGTSVTTPRGGTCTVSGGSLLFEAGTTIGVDACYAQVCQSCAGNRICSVTRLPFNVVAAPMAVADVMNGTANAIGAATGNVLRKTLLDNDAGVSTSSFTLVPPVGAVTVGSTTALTRCGGAVTVSGAGEAARVDYLGLATPSAACALEDTFRYRVCGSGSQSSNCVVAEVTVSLNAFPVAAADTVTAVEDTQLTIEVASLLGNDSDPNHKPTANPPVLDPVLFEGLIAGSAVGGTATYDGVRVYFTPAANSTTAGSFQYRVVDGGGLTATTTVTVNITAANDAPVFTTETTASVSESATVNDLIRSISAQDADAGDTLGYTLTLDAGDEGRFTLTQLTAVAGVGASAVTRSAELRLGALVDFEQKPVYRVTVRVTDLAGAFAEQVLLVTVSNANDAPQIVSAATASVAENTPVPAIIRTAVAVEPDRDPIVWSLDGADVAAFAIDATTGVLTLTQSPNFESKGTYNVTLVATDAPASGVTPLVATQPFTLTVEDRNDPPTATAKSEVTAEDVPVTILNTTLTAGVVDQDQGDTFSIVGVGSPSNCTLALTSTGVVVTPAVDFTGQATFEYTLRDEDGAMSSAVVTVTVTGDNDAPVLVTTASPALAAVNEDAAAPTAGSTAGSTLVSAVVMSAAPLSNVTDADSGSAAGLAITGVSASGTLHYSLDNGTTWLVASAPTGTSALLLPPTARLFFRPAANINGAVAEAITFRAWDTSSGTGGSSVNTSSNGGATAFSTATDTASVAVNAVNDAPTVAGTTASYTMPERTTMTLHGTGLSIADIDAGAGSVVLTLTVTGGSFADSTLAAIAGTTGVQVGGTAQALTLTGSVAAINDLLGGVGGATLTHANARNNPTAVTLDLSVSDNGNTGSGGALTGTLTRSIAFGDVNDVPTVTMPPTAFTATEQTAFNLHGKSIVIDDVDAATNEILSVRVSVTAGNGTLNVIGATGVTVTTATGEEVVFSGKLADLKDVFTGTNTGRLTYTASSDAPPASTTLRVRVTDNGTPSAETGEATKTINITAVNDAPVLANATGTVTFTEDGSPVVIRAALTLTDADSATLTGATVSITGNRDATDDELVFANTANITGTWSAATGVLTLAGTDSVANYEAALRTVTYRNNDTAAPTTLSRTITWGATDGAAPATAVTSTVAVTAVNDVPVVGAVGGTVNFNEGGSLVVIDNNLTVTDVDSATLSGATVTISGNFQTAQDRLGFTASGGVNGSFDTGTGVLTLTGAASAATYQTVLRTVTYDNIDNAGAVGSPRTITWVVLDTGVQSSPVTSTVTVTTNNTAPTLSGVNATDSFTEGGVALTLDSNVTISDPDDSNLESATVAITANFASAEDVLDATVSGALSRSYNAATGVLTISGTATEATYDAALETVTYRNTNTENPSTLARTLTWTLNDGEADSTAVTSTVNVSGTNDTPTDIALSSLLVAENAGADAVVGALSTVDPDGDTSFTYTLVSGTGSTDNAAFNISGTSLRATASLNFEAKSSYAVRIQTNDGSATFQKALTVTVTDVNEAPSITSTGGTSATEDAAYTYNATATDPEGTLATPTWSTVSPTHTCGGSIGAATGVFTFTPAGPIPSASCVVALKVCDGGSPDACSTTQSFTVNVAAVNDAPTGVSLGTLTLAENAGPNAVVGALSTVDPDGDTSFTYTLVAGTGDTDNAAFNIDGSNLRATASLNFEAKSSYSVRVQTNDGGAGGTFAQQFTVTVTDANDAPTSTATLVSTSEDATRTLAALEFSFADVDAGAALAAVRVTGLPTNGKLRYRETSGGPFVDVTVADLPLDFDLVQLAAGDLVFQPDAHEFGAPYASFTYVVWDGSLFSSPATTMTVNVTEVNDAPVFNAGTTFVQSYAENGSAAVPVDVTVTDADLTDSATYTLSGGADQARFAITSGGVLTFQSSPNFEAPTDADGNNTYVVDITVADGRGGTDVISVTVTVTNVNEAPVLSVGATQAVSVADGATAVIDLDATDAENDSLTFTKSGDDAGDFALDASTGVLTFSPAPSHASPADANADNVYLVTVTVSDGASSDTVDLTVTVNAP